MKRIGIFYPKNIIYAQSVRKLLKQLNCENIEFETFEQIPNALLLNKIELGIVYCDLNEISILNQFKEVRCVQSNSARTVKYAREVLDTNILCVNKDKISEANLLEIIGVFLSTNHIKTIKSEEILNKIDQLTKDQYIT